MISCSVACDGEGVLSAAKPRGDLGSTGRSESRPLETEMHGNLPTERCRMAHSQRSSCDNLRNESLQRNERDI